MSVSTNLNIPLQASTNIPADFSGQGQIAYDLQTERLMFCNGSVWTDVGTGGVGTVTSIGTGTGLSGGPITGAGIISLANTNVISGSYTYPSNVIVNPQGQITSIMNGTGGATGTVTNIATTSDFTVNGMPGGTITTAGTLGLTATGVNIALNPYMNPSSISVNASGQITAITAGSAPTNGTVTSVATTSSFTVNGTVGGTITTTGTLGLNASGVDNTMSPYSYPSSISVNAAGQITSMTAGSAPGSGTVTSVATTSAFTVNGTVGGTITTTGTLGLNASGVDNTMSPYSYPSSITVNPRDR